MKAEKWLVYSLGDRCLIPENLFQKFLYILLFIWDILIFWKYRKYHQNLKTVKFMCPFNRSSMQNGNTKKF